MTQACGRLGAGRYIEAAATPAETVTTVLYACRIASGIARAYDRLKSGEMSVATYVSTETNTTDMSIAIVDLSLASIGGGLNCPGDGTSRRLII